MLPRNEQTLQDNKQNFYVKKQERAEQTHSLSRRRKQLGAETNDTENWETVERIHEREN